MSREIIKIDTKSKAEAIAGLEMALDRIKNGDFEGTIEFTVEVTNEGHVIN